MCDQNLLPSVELQRAYNFSLQKGPGDVRTGIQAPAAMIRNMSESWQNTSVETVEVATENVDNNWLIHEYDNITVIDNAPYVGLRKVDSLIQYLLVRVRSVAGEIGHRMCSK